MLPGGKIDSGETPQEAALREMHEEIGIHPDEVSFVRKLGMVTTPFGVKLHVFIGFLPSDLDLTLNPDEVEEVFSVPFTFSRITQPSIIIFICIWNQMKSFPQKTYRTERIISGRKFIIEKTFITTKTTLSGD